MRYLIATEESMLFNYLAHHGVKGQKWGIRRYQNADGSLTAEGKARYAGVTTLGQVKRRTNKLKRELLNEYREKHPNSTKEQTDEFKRNLKEQMKDAYKHGVYENANAIKGRMAAGSGALAIAGAALGVSGRNLGNQKFEQERHLRDNRNLADAGGYYTKETVEDGTPLAFRQDMRKVANNAISNTHNQGVAIKIGHAAAVAALGTAAAGNALRMKKVSDIQKELDGDFYKDK